MSTERRHELPVLLWYSEDAEELEQRTASPLPPLDVPCEHLATLGEEDLALDWFRVLSPSPSLVSRLRLWSAGGDELLRGEPTPLPAELAGPGLPPHAQLMLWMHADVASLQPLLEDCEPYWAARLRRMEEALELMLTTLGPGPRDVPHWACLAWREDHKWADCLNCQQHAWQLKQREEEVPQWYSVRLSLPDGSPFMLGLYRVPADDEHLTRPHGNVYEVLQEVAVKLKAAGQPFGPSDIHKRLVESGLQWRNVGSFELRLDFETGDP